MKPVRISRKSLVLLPIVIKEEPLEKNPQVFSQVTRENHEGVPQN